MSQAITIIASGQGALVEDKTDGRTIVLMGDMLGLPGSQGGTGAPGIGVIAPETYGAVGDGVTDDTDAFLAMIADAGVGAAMSGTAGATYLVSSELAPLAGQTFQNMKFKRAAQAKTTLTAAMTDTVSTSVTLQVASSAAFRVGSYVTITKASPTASDITNETHTDKSVHLILSKTATTITVGTGFALTFAIGDEVISAYHIFRNTAAGVRWIDCEFDGNRANWQNKGMRWETVTEIRTTGAGCHINRLKMANIPGEGVQLGGAGSTMINWSASNCGGNPVHLSGGNDLIVSDFNVDGANRVWFETDEAYAAGRPVVPGTMGHEDGGVAWSLGCDNAKVSRGTIRNALSGFSPPVSETADEASIADLTVIDCAMPFKITTFDTFAQNVGFSNCKFTNCNRGFIGRFKANASETESQIRTVLRDNWFINTQVTIQNAHFVDVLGGGFVHTDAQFIPARGVIEVTGGSKHVRIDTLIDGGELGILAIGAVEYLDASGTRMRRIQTAGVSFSNIDAGMKGNRMIGGEIAAHPTLATAGFNGFISNGGDEASQIEFDLLSAPAGARCILADNGSRHYRNICRIASGVIAVRAFGGTSGIVAKDNFATVYPGTWELASSFSNGGGASNTFADNFALA